MDVDELKRKVRAGLKRTPFSISGATLAAADLTALFTAAWGEDELTLTGAGEVGDDATGIVLSGTLPVLAKLTNKRVTATFRVDGGRVTLRVELDKIDSLRLSDCFGQLEHGVFRRYALTAATLALDSANHPRLPDDFPKGFGLPAHPDRIRKNTVLGLGVTGTLSPGTTTGDVVAWLLPKTSYSVSGALALPCDQLGVALTARTIEPVTILNRFEVSCALSLVAGALADGDALLGVTNLMQVAGTVTAKVGNNRSLTLPFSARCTTSTPSVLTLPCLPARTTAVTLAEIGALLDPVVAEHVKGLPALSGAQLRRLDITLAPRKREVLAVGATVGWTSSDALRLFDGLLAVKDLEVSFTYLPARPSGQRVTAEVTGKAAVKNCALTVRLQMPSRTVSAELAPNCAADLTELVKQLADGIPLPDLTATGLLIGGIGKDLRLRAALRSAWQPFGTGVKVELTDLVLDLTRLAGKVGASIGATMRLGAVELHGTGLYDFTSRQWAFEFATSTGVTLSVKTLVQQLKTIFNVEPPGTAPDITVDAFSLSFTKDSYVLTCSTSVEVDGVRLQAAVEVTKDKYAGRVVIGDLLFEGAVQGRRLCLSWTAPKVRNVTLRALVEALGVADPGLSGLLDVRVTGAALVAEKGEGVAWAATTTKGRVSVSRCPGRRSGAWWSTPPCRPGCPRCRSSARTSRPRWTCGSARSGSSRPAPGSGRTRPRRPNC